MSVWDVDEGEELMNSAKLASEVFDIFAHSLVMDCFEDNEDILVEKDIPEAVLKERFEQEFYDSDFTVYYSMPYQYLIEWAYFLSEGYEPDPEADYDFGFPELYVDAKNYETMFKAIGIQKDKHIDIDTL